MVGYDEIDPKNGLKAVVHDIEELNARRSELLHERDMLMLAARDAGCTWKELGEISGLSLRMIKVSLDRAQGRA